VTDRRTPDPELVARLQTTLRDSPHLRLAVLFGSAAAGASRVDSDLDIAILPASGGLDVAGEAALRARLTRVGRADVDLIRLDEVGSTLLRWQIATTGVPLFEAHPGAFARFRAEAAAEYIDFAPALAHHGDIFRRRLIAQGERR
jgi:predicted nucleotidyltransferase